MMPRILQALAGLIVLLGSQGAFAAIAVHLDESTVGFVTSDDVKKINVYQDNRYLTTIDPVPAVWEVPEPGTYVFVAVNSDNWLDWEVSDPVVVGGADTPLLWVEEGALVWDVPTMLALAESYPYPHRLLNIHRSNGDYQTTVNIHDGNWRVNSGSGSYYVVVVNSADWSMWQNSNTVTVSFDKNEMRGVDAENYQAELATAFEVYRADHVRPLIELHEKAALLFNEVSPTPESIVEDGGFPWHDIALGAQTRRCDDGSVVRDIVLFQSAIRPADQPYNFPYPEIMYSMDFQSCRLGSLTVDGTLDVYSSREHQSLDVADVIHLSDDSGDATFTGNVNFSLGSAVEIGTFARRLVHTRSYVKQAGEHRVEIGDSAYYASLGTSNNLWSERASGSFSINGKEVRYLTSGNLNYGNNNYSLEADSLVGKADFSLWYSSGSQLEMLSTDTPPTVDYTITDNDGNTSVITENFAHAISCNDSLIAYYREYICDRNAE